MARPSKISEEQILEAAHRLFIERGHGVTTAEIAKDLGISEGSIFKRFPTKQKLLMAAMGLENFEWVERIDALEPLGDVIENVAALIRQGVATFSEMMPRMMTLWAAKDLSPMDMTSCPNSPPRMALRALTAYFSREIDAGRVHADDPEIPARMLMGAVANFVFVKMMGLQAPTPVSLDVYAKAVAETLWHGISPGSAPSAKTPETQEQS